MLSRLCGRALSMHSAPAVSACDIFRLRFARCLVQAAVDALTYVEQSMALVPLFDGTDLRELQAAAEDGAVSVKRRLFYEDEDQGVLLGQALH